MSGRPPSLTLMVDVGACAWMQASPGPSPYDEEVDLPTGDLLASLRARDPHTLEQLVSEHARRLYRGARSMGFSTGEAEDLAQDVFVTFLETLDRFEGRAQVGTWLFGILYRKAHERRRSRQRDERTEAIEQVFEARFDADGAWTQPPVRADRLVESRQAAEAVRDCAGTLPDLRRDVFHLRQVEERSAADVSAILNVTLNHVGVLLHRARLLLRACLEGKGHGPKR